MAAMGSRRAIIRNPGYFRVVVKGAIRKIYAVASLQYETKICTVCQQILIPFLFFSHAGTTDHRPNSH